MKQREPLQTGRFYHIYNRGNNRENLFREERNYRYFLQLYARHIEPIADTYAYCLMRNHFHLLVRIKTEDEALSRDRFSDSDRRPMMSPRTSPSKHFSNLFNAYTKAINKAYQRTGSLFEERFGRIEVTTDSYFTNLIFYIHFNPQKHGFVADFREWPWSSFGTLLSGRSTHLQRDEVLRRFGDTDRLDAFHRGGVDEKLIQPLIGEDFD